MSCATSGETNSVAEGLSEFAYFFFHTLLRKQTIHQLSLHSNSSSPTSLSTTSELLLGAAAGGLAQIFTIPVSVVATRQQLWTPPPSSTSSPKGKNVKGLSLLETAKEIIDESGPSGLWTGLKPGLVLTVNPAITYGAFERLKSYVLTSSGREGGRLGLTESFLIGVISKAIATVVTYPYIFVSCNHTFLLLNRSQGLFAGQSSTSGKSWSWRVDQGHGCSSSSVRIIRHIRCCSFGNS